MNYTGKIIVLAYPDTFVTMSDEWICKFLPLVGLGTQKYIKAGHAALILVENESGMARYYDFGRYVTPAGHGRVRGSNTDAELEIPFKAILDSGDELQNLDEFLLWLDANPQKTHGEGRLLASVCDAIHYESAHGYISNLQKRGSIPYGAFHKDGSNCSRFVTDTILSATLEKRIIKALKFNKRFTPSAVGNVEKAAPSSNVWEVSGGQISPFTSSAFKENLVNYFHRTPHWGLKSVPRETMPNAVQKLEGIGSSAYFYLTSESGLGKAEVRIRRYNDLGEMDFDGVFFSKHFRRELPYTFTYDSHCEFCHVLQDGHLIQLQFVKKFSEVNSAQKVRSA